MGFETVHKEYRKVLDKFYCDIADTTLSTISIFYGSLPPPSELTAEFVQEKLRAVAPATRRTYMSYVRALEKFLGRDLLGTMRTPKVPKSGLTKDDLYTKEELAKIWAACDHTRDRAIFQVLFEAALRADELLGLDIKHIRPEKRLWWLTVTGKGSKTRPVPILNAIPSLQAWLDVHPIGDGPVFTTIKRPFKRMAYSTLRERGLLVLSRAEIMDKRRSLHNFRHTRLTELAGMGLTEAEMCTFAGWEPGSPMTSVYVHLSGRDLKRSFGRIYGLQEEQEEPALKMESRQCPRCKKKNPAGARFCSQCSLVLDEELALRLQPEDTSRADRETVRALVQDIIREELGLSKDEGQDKE